MQIQVNTGNNIEGRDELASRVTNAIEDTLGHFGERLTRIEAYLSDMNSHKAGPADIRCVLEARPAGMKPLAASHQADAVDLAVQGAAEKLKRSLDSTLGQLDDRQRRGGEERGGEGENL